MVMQSVAIALFLAPLNLAVWLAGASFLGVGTGWCIRRCSP
jgi:hypothetical protein